jgi:hypothetical protein
MKNENRNKLNFYIDILLFINLGLLIGIGLLIKYVLISGQQKWLLLGSNPELTFWGLDRHQWGTIHLITGIVFFILLILHIIFHWRMIGCLFRKYIPKRGVRAATIFISLIVFTIFVAFPLIVSPEKKSIFPGEGRVDLESMVELNDSIKVQLKKPKKIGSRKEDIDIQVIEEKPHKEHVSKKENDITIKGSMQLKEVGDKYNVPVSYLKEELDLPVHISDLQKLGRLKKRYNFTMSEVEDVVLKFREENK